MSDDGKALMIYKQGQRIKELEVIERRFRYVSSTAWFQDAAEHNLSMQETQTQFAFDVELAKRIDRALDA